MNQRKPAWDAGEWACAAWIVFAMIYLLLTVVPAFFDGRVAQAVR